MSNDISVKLDGLASLLQSRGMLKYAYGVDQAADVLDGNRGGSSIHPDQQKLVNAYDSVKEKDVGHKVFEDIRKQVEHHFVDSGAPSALKDFVGAVTVSSKSELLDFIMEIVKFLHHGYKLSSSDRDFLDTFERICVTS